MDEDTFYLDERQRMVDEQLASRDIRDSRVLEAMREIPRHIFVPREHRHLAYKDAPLPIGNGQTISQPYIVAFMTQLLYLEGEEIVLEIGTGSGYQAALLGHLAREVHTVERQPRLADRATMLLVGLGLQNVYVHVGDGTLGWPDEAPYDRILATAAAPDVPPPLFDQLADGGRMVIPVGGRGEQYLECWIRQEGRLIHKPGPPVAFVPMLGAYGWREEDWL
jgi:protein-L-isoaspartate(D-aspartate) O-methyltransferase